ncbi:MAG TPA: FAD-linked oxidase C-terminal domain-containing protein, partial [Pyrinomonadaceae bacterium]|nr:FAD-linked oxidase C-terminal domain-containing protein [Pyrinomonadaceae bacterium]
NFGHLGDGNIHVNFMCDRSDPEAVRRAREAVGETFAASVDLGGTISGEHGIGYVKAPYLKMALDPETVAAMLRIKRALDPKGILNPGKMFV